MLKIILQWITSYCVGLALAGLQYWLTNNYISDYLFANIISIQLSVISINLATLGIVATKLADLIDKGYSPASFEKSVRQMRLSITEQVTLIATAGLFGVLSKLSIKEQLIPFGNAVIIGLLVQHVRILIDTGNAIFIALIESSKIKKS